MSEWGLPRVALEIVGIHKCGLDTESTERMLQQVESTAVNRALGHHMVALAGKCRNRIGNGCGAGCHGESGNATFERGNTFFEYALGAVGDASIDVTACLQYKTVSSVLGVVENVGRGLVNRNRAGIGCGVCVFLANVELKSFKMEFVLCCHGKNSF